MHGMGTNRMGVVGAGAGAGSVALTPLLLPPAAAAVAAARLLGVGFAVQGYCGSTSMHTVHDTAEDIASPLGFPGMANWPLPVVCMLVSWHVCACVRACVRALCVCDTTDGWTGW